MIARWEWAGLPGSLCAGICCCRSSRGAGMPMQSPMRRSKRRSLASRMRRRWWKIRSRRRRQAGSFSPITDLVTKNCRNVWLHCISRLALRLSGLRRIVKKTCGPPALDGSHCCDAFFSIIRLADGCMGCCGGLPPARIAKKRFSNPLLYRMTQFARRPMRLLPDGSCCRVS